MKAMILAAGRGERMRPLTDNLPKPLLKVGSKTLIEYHIDALQKAGIRELVINHAWLGYKIEQYLGNGSQLGVNIQYSREQQALETAGGIIQALELLGHEPFIVVNGDIFTDYNYSRLSYLKTDRLAHLVLVNNPEHNSEGDFYLNSEAAGESDIYTDNASDGTMQAYTFSGIGLYHPDFFADIKPGRQALAPLLREAMNRHQVSGELYQGTWLDIGTPQRLAELNQQYI